MRFLSRLRSPWFILVASTVTLLLLVVVFYFEPQAALFDDEVADSVPTAAVLSAATGFVSLEHGTSGGLLVGSSADGRFIRIEGLSTTNGPDLRVYLSTNAVDGAEGAFDEEFVDLGALRGNLGDQNYALDESVDLTKYRSVVIWCDRFDAAFGAAPLPA